MARIELGDKVKDPITGLKGIVVGMTEWLHGCTRVVIQPQELKDGKPAETSCFDEPQLEVIEKNAIKRGKKDTGGPGPNAEKRADVRR